MADAPDFTAISVPLNAAAKIIAHNMGKTWDREIVITLSIPKGEYHVGPTSCRLNPRTVVGGDIVKVITKLFSLAEELEVKKRDHKAEAIAFEKEEVKKKMTYLRRALHNGEFESFIFDDLLPIPKPSHRKEIPEGGALCVLSQCPRPFMWRD